MPNICRHCLLVHTGPCWGSVSWEYSPKSTSAVPDRSKWRQPDEKLVTKDVAEHLQREFEQELEPIDDSE